jgi:hypothetical protein
VRRREPARPAGLPARITDDVDAASDLWLDVARTGRLESPELEWMGEHQLARMRATRLKRLIESLDSDRPDLHSLRPGGLDALLAALGR